MNRLFLIVLVATVTCMSTAAIAQKTTQDLLREIQSSNRTAQLEMEQSRLRWQQMEAEEARRHTEIDRLKMKYESQEITDRVREIEERAEQAAAEQEEADRKAEEAAEELRNELEQAAVRTKNSINLAVLLIFIVGFVVYVVRKYKKEPIMQENQKFGIATIIGSSLVILLAVVISDGWVYRFDLLQNLMSALRIKFLSDESGYDAYYIDIPTKYVILACICAAAYGLTTYLGITPAPRKSLQQQKSASDEVVR